MSLRHDPQACSLVRVRVLASIKRPITRKSHHTRLYRGVHQRKFFVTMAIWLGHYFQILRHLMPTNYIEQITTQLSSSLKGLEDGDPGKMISAETMSRPNQIDLHPRSICRMSAVCSQRNHIKRIHQNNIISFSRTFNDPLESEVRDCICMFNNRAVVCVQVKHHSYLLWLRVQRKALGFSPFCIIVLSKVSRIDLG